MSRYNLFIVAGPLHLMNAIEAIHHFETQNNILLILYTDNKKQLNQMERLLDFADWDSISYLSLPQKATDKIFFARYVHNKFADISKREIDKIFVGEYRSDHVNHIVNYFNDKDIYLLDDGLAQIDYHKEMSYQPYKVKIRRVIYKMLSYKLSPIKYTFFTIFDIKNERVIKNEYSFFKKYINKKDREDLVYFIGQPLIELGVVSEESYKKEFAKIIRFYKNKKLIYITHRREDESKVKRISKELGFEYKEFDNLIELEMINAKVVPSDFATFFSTAIVTLPSFIKGSIYRVFKMDDKFINKKFIENISESYLEFEKMGLKMELL